MKCNHLILLLALTLQAAAVCLLSADEPTPPAGNGAAAPALTPDERAQVRKIQTQVLAADPALKAEDDDLKQKRQDMDDQGAGVSPDARKAFFATWHAHQLKVRAAALKIDPTLAPIYAKQDQWRQAHMKPQPSGG